VTDEELRKGLEVRWGGSFEWSQDSKNLSRLTISDLCQKALETCEKWLAVSL